MGRAAVDLYANEIGIALEEVSSFSKYVGGCPANIAIGASRLGLRTGMLSAVGDEAMGRFVRATLQREGVDTAYLHTKSDHLTGLVLLGIDPPDRFPLIFYRENCADMALTEDDFDLSLFQTTHSLLITGTHCSKHQSFQMTKRAVALAKEAAAEVILDIDYRPVLWGAAGHGSGEARDTPHQMVSERLSELFSACSLIVGTEEELCVATNRSSAAEAVIALRRASSALIVQKRGREGCVVYPPKGEPIIGHPYPVDVLNVLGAGDAFLSGFLRGYLRRESLERCCQLGNANGALVVTRHGCAPAMGTLHELEEMIADGCYA